ncbi:TonB-dependent receptor (plasmid) [Novosphingobium resinovorum]|uniref:TonB-dependent receptor n=1 Tax=Novosphingobium TaxID=165696 RepID=UPI001B3C5125|nr:MULTISPECIES: TonB-dependent receptor [Novosphingobium]MBF7015671.1 TonB-dependent receptor [Novosphingobium sp. HR1a]WJM30345.1 TonB-dependent receptor [Novosphingobium resinovorum]
MTAAPALAQAGSAGEEARATEDDSGDKREILVTARRRTERLQAVPIAVTVADDRDLGRADVQSVSGLGAITPSISFRNANIASSTANLIVRGLGTSGSNRSFEGSVAIFVDGVYRTRAAAALQNFLDVGEVQVLRGPQSTLFGKNTTAGAVLLSSTRPRFDAISGKGEIAYGSYDTLLLRASTNLPLADHAALRIATTISHTAGFYSDVTRNRSLNGSTTRGAKADLLVELAGGTTVQLIGDVSRGTGNCCYATSPVVVGPLQPFIDSLIVAAGGVVPSERPRDRQQSLNGDGREAVDDYGAALIIEAAVFGGALKSTTGYRHYSVDQINMDPDFSGADIFRYDESFRSRFLSQEVTFSLPVERLSGTLLLGAFVSDEQLVMGRKLPWGAQAQPVWDALLSGLGLPPGTADASPGLIAHEDMGGAARTYSVFAHAETRLTSRLSIAGGIRYSIEDKTGRFAYRYYRPAAAEPFRLLGIQPGPPYDATHHDGAISGTAGIEFQASSSTLLYATYNHGFKSGGVNIDANGAGTRENNPAEVPGGRPLDPEYRPETIDAFEVGAKVSYLGGAARTNVALFHYDISSLQIAQFVGTRTTVINAKGAEDYGVEIENRLHLTRHLALDADLTWIARARYDAAGGIDPVLAGARFRFAPRVSANLAASIDAPVSRTMSVTGRVQYRYTSSQFVDTAGSYRQGPVDILDIKAGVGFPSARLNLEVGVRNLLDVTYVEQVLATPLQAGSYSGFLGAPRTFEARVTKTF